MRLVASHGSSACCPLSRELSVRDAQPDGCDVGVRGLRPSAVIAGAQVGTVNLYLAALATPLPAATISQQAVPTSATSLSPGFPWGVRFLGNPTTTCCPPDGLLPVGETGRGYFVPTGRLPVGVGASAVRRDLSG
jgi:hypothetical protein